MTSPFVAIPLEILSGPYTLSHSSFWRAVPGYLNNHVPLLFAYDSAVAIDDLGHYTEVAGFALGALAGFVNFHGDGTFDGGATVVLAGVTYVGGAAYEEITFTGTYLLWAANAGPVNIVKGTFTIAADPPVKSMEYFFVMADGWNELHFTLRQTGTPAASGKQAVTTGVMRKIEGAPAPFKPAQTQAHEPFHPSQTQPDKLPHPHA